VAEQKEQNVRQCPGDKTPISAAICRTRQQRRYSKCATCKWREETLEEKRQRAKDDPRRGVFKAYDIRGVYPDQLDEKLAEMIGQATARFLNAESLAIGRDMRASSPAMSRALIQGIVTAGGNVLDVGLISTDANYFAINRYQQSGGVMVTASHNPAQYIGFKVSREEAIPVGSDSGLNNIRDLALGSPMRPSEKRGKIREKNLQEDYTRHVLSFVRHVEPLNVVIDTGNGMAGHMLPPILEQLPLTVTPLYFELDGSFPHHEANPLKAENLRDLQRVVRETGADLGVAFDGDGDRVMFVDEHADIVRADLVTAVIAKNLLQKHKKGPIVYDVRSSWAVAEEIRKYGGIPSQERVGHAFMKAALRARNAVFGGELSGHYYFRDNFYTDSGLIALVELLNALSAERKPMSEVMAPLQRYHATGEVNFEVEDKEAKLKQLGETFKDGKISRLDGITVEFEDWWFNVRPSNTEPLLRLNLEATSRELMEKAQEKVSEIIVE